MIDKDIKAYIDAEIEKVKYKNDALQSSLQEECKNKFDRIEKQRIFTEFWLVASIIVNAIGAVF